MRGSFFLFEGKLTKLSLCTLRPVHTTKLGERDFSSMAIEVRMLEHCIAGG